MRQDHKTKERYTSQRRLRYRLLKGKDQVKKIVIISLFFLITAGVVVYGTAYMVRLHNNNRYTDGPIAKDSVSFFVTNDMNTIDLSFIMQEEEDYTLLTQDATNPLTYHIIFSKGDNDLFSGEFLTDWDYTKPKRAAVLGKNVSRNDCEIVGVIDDDLLFGGFASCFLLDMDIRSIPSECVITITSEIEGHAGKVYESLNESALKQGLLLKKVQLANVVFGHYESNESKMIITVILFWCVMLVLTGMAAYFWFVVRKSFYRVLLIFGSKTPLLKVYFPLVLSAVLSFSAQAVLFVTLRSDSLYITGIVLKTASLLYIGLLIPVLPVAIYLRGTRS